MPRADTPDPLAAVPTGSCARCGREVLTHVDFLPDGTLVRRCLHCDGPVADLHMRPESDLPALGYALLPGGCSAASGGCASCPVAKPG